jgi:hypothetical protein
MNVILFQLDGKIPNIALMRIAEHHRQLGDDVELRWGGNPERSLWDEPKAVYGSAIFEKTRPVVEKLKQEFPEAIVGGTGVDVTSSLEEHGITTTQQDYSIYPKWQQSIGFTQRGCRLACSFCVVPRKEGAWREEKSITELWRGEPWARELILLDNDFFGHPKADRDNQHWRKCIQEIRDGKFKVSFNQGINARFLTDEAAEAIASIDYRDDQMKVKRIYTAWDNRKDEERLFAGLNRLVKYGVPRSAIMVYMLIGYWPGETEDDWVYRAKQLREFGAMPYPMPYVRNPATIGFQRWAITHYIDKVPWADWKTANYHEHNLRWEQCETEQISGNGDKRATREPDLYSAAET